MQDIESAQIFHDKYASSECAQDGSALKNQYKREFQFIEQKLGAKRASFKKFELNSHVFQLQIGIWYKDKNGTRLTQKDMLKMENLNDKLQAFCFEPEMSLDEVLTSVLDTSDMKV